MGVVVQDFCSGLAPPAQVWDKDTSRGPRNAPGGLPGRGLDCGAESGLLQRIPKPSSVVTCLYSRLCTRRGPWL